MEEKYGDYPYPIIEQLTTLWSAVFNGDVEASKAELLKQKDRTPQSKHDFEKSILNLRFVADKVLGYPMGNLTAVTIMDLVPFIVDAEAQHPGNFEKYRSLLEFVDRTAGVGSVLNRWKEYEEACSFHHGSGTGYGRLTVLYEHEKVAISDQMKGYFQRMILREAINQGDVETSKKVLSEISKGPFSSLRINWGSQLDPSQTVGRADLVSWILKSEYDHPGHFLDYKQILDFVAQKDGVDKVIDRWKHPIYWRISCTKKEGQKLVSLSVPTSPQMAGYLSHLEDVRTVDPSTNDPGVPNKKRKNDGR